MASPAALKLVKSGGKKSMDGPWQPRERAMKNVDPRIGTLVKWNSNFQKLAAADQAWLKKFGDGPFTIISVTPKGVTGK